MKSLFLAAATILFTQITLADQIPNPSAQAPGINEAVTMRYVNGIWRSGSAEQHEVVSKFIPVTREAFAQLAKLDKSAGYRCVVGAATVETSGTDLYFGGITRTYFILDINCN